MSDLTFLAWYIGAACCLVAATALAYWLTTEPTPAGRHRATPRRAASDPAVPPTAVPRQPEQHPETPTEPDDLYVGPLLRAHIDRTAWLAELDEMQRQYQRREALRAAAEGQPDPGYTYPGAHAVTGAVA
ncbi:hypothetical protein [Kitasatospora sp. NPDC001527]|uniref:hypothetical protein n=1 Tax=Kitasatospora sp. NPDC001527 TaxID=3154519 RepID=UPI00332D470B